MTSSGDALASARALILTPHGRDSRLAAALLTEVGQASQICDDLDAFVSGLGEDTAFGILTEETVRHADLAPLLAAISAQPNWSALPFIVLTRHGGGPERNPEAARLSEILGNVTFLERPFHATTFASVVRGARRGRERQFETRAAVMQLHRSDETLRTALMAGRLGAWELHPASRELICSPTLRTIFGRPADGTFDFHDFVSSIHEDDLDRVMATIENATIEGRDYAVEFRAVWPDGSLHWAEAHARIQHDPDGTPRLIGVTSDVTPASRPRPTTVSRLRSWSAAWRSALPSWKARMPACSRKSVSANAPKASFCKARRWRRSASSPAAWRMISTIC
ncbi:PAS domain-containing protein [Limimaricola cinnabarinus]|uniref:histidine kinase n=1 Tax=Limimaricola cinnabarinus LL-001 TaxID=1337093 RepID=U2Z7R1_9RHOB|nr:PAS domain-containing protein [Limimaricola cinnabarinus]GAD57102.1 histidine kinase/response regulator hybrid protein [Limimaricola cinnabarinus LL-001]